MRLHDKLMRAAWVLPCMLLAASAVHAGAGGPDGGPPARACLRLESRPAAFGPLGCTRFVVLRNSCDRAVLAEVGSTQQLLSGTLSETLHLVVPASGERSLGCAWWSGALAPTRYQPLGARFAAGPARRGDRSHHRSD